MPDEEWRAIAKYVGYYEISSLGRLRSLDRVIPHARHGTIRRRGKILAPSVKNKYGHLGTTLFCGNRGEQVWIHILVLETFVGPCPPKMECRHLNGEPDDNRLDNLAWGTRKQNAADRKRHGRAALHDETNGRFTG